MISFTPNTITYMVPEESQLGARISRAKLGIIFHTTYKGSSISKLKASFGANVSKLRRIEKSTKYSLNLICPSLPGFLGPKEHCFNK